VCIKTLSTRLFAGRDVKTVQEVRQVFLECENDGRAVCFAAVVARDVGEVRRAADLGAACAQAGMSESKVSFEGKFLWGEESAAQGERDGFNRLGRCYRYGWGCLKDVERAKECFLISSELGHLEAMKELVECLDKTDPQCFYWLGKAAAAVNGRPFTFLRPMQQCIRKFISGTTRLANVVFVIGRALKGQVDNEERTIFGEEDNFDIYIDRKSSSSFPRISVAVVSKSC
jgi:TPR repeat protein